MGIFNTNHIMFSVYQYPDVISYTSNQFAYLYNGDGTFTNTGVINSTNSSTSNFENALTYLPVSNSFMTTYGQYGVTTSGGLTKIGNDHIIPFGSTWFGTLPANGSLIVTVPDGGGNLNAINFYPDFF